MVVQVAAPPGNPGTPGTPTARGYHRRVDEGVHDTGSDQGGSTDGAARRLRVLLVIKVPGLRRRRTPAGRHGGHRRPCGRSTTRWPTCWPPRTAWCRPSTSAGTPVHRLGATGNADLRWMAAAPATAGRRTLRRRPLPPALHGVRWGDWWCASLPAADRPAIVYTEHSLWNKMAVLVKVLNRATIGLDQSLIVVSQAAHDALPARAPAPGPGDRPRRRPVPVRRPDRPTGRASRPRSAPSSGCPTASSWC